MPALSTIRNTAAGAAKSRGHKLKWDKPFKGWASGQSQNAKCICGAEVQINTNPAPNQIDIGGSAIAVDCTVTHYPVYLIRVYSKYTYDVWGNAKEGYEVNDRRAAGEMRIRCKKEVLNKGTPHEFIKYDPTDLQLALASNEKGVEWDGESDYTLYGNRKRDGKPICEYVFEGFEVPGSPWILVRTLKEVLARKIKS
jgi:hypothetical protein